MIDYTRSEMTILHNDRFSELVLDDLTHILEKVFKVTAEGGSLDYEYRIRHRNGDELWIHDIATYDKEQNIFLVSIMDISYRQVALDSMSDVIDSMKFKEKQSIEKRNTSFGHLIHALSDDFFYFTHDLNGLNTRVSIANDNKMGLLIDQDFDSKLAQDLSTYDHESDVTQMIIEGNLWSL